MTAIAFVAIVAVYLAIAIGVTYWLTGFGTGAGAKWAIALSTLFAFLALAVWDEVWGYVYLRHLCATESGIKVYKTVTLGPEHWNEDGSPKFFNKDAARGPFLDGRYEIKGSGTTVVRWPTTVRYERAIIDRQTGERLVVFVDFSGHHGWVLQAPGWHAGGRACPVSYKDLDRTIISSAFRKPSSK